MFTLKRKKKGEYEKDREQKNAERDSSGKSFSFKPMLKGYMLLIQIIFHHFLVVTNL